jgi:hypothetical protein
MDLSVTVGTDQITLGQLIDGLLIPAIFRVTSLCQQERAHAFLFLAGLSVVPVKGSQTPIVSTPLTLSTSEYFPVF